MRKLVLNYLLIVTFCCISPSCNKWLTIQPKEMLTETEMFKSLLGYENALAGIYSLMQEQYECRGYLMTGFIEHLACQWDVKKGSEGEFANLHEYGNFDPLITTLFKDQYKILVNVNLLLNNTIENEILSNEGYRKYRGQALAIRAFLHFDLIRLFGPVPSTANGNTKYISYVTKMTVAPHSYDTYSAFMEKLMNDLSEAEALLTPQTVADEMAIGAAYFSYGSVLALKSRIHLWLGEKKEALYYADSVKNLSKFSKNVYFLSKRDGGEVDLLSKSEHILHFTYTVTSTEVLEHENTLDYLNDDLFAGSVSDTRLLQWVLNPTTPEGQLPNYVLFKYNIFSENAKGMTPLIRLSEMYFNLMECESDLDKVNSYYQEFCEAREIVYTPIQNEGEKLTILLNEYRKEFVGEGQLFYAYKRWNVRYMPRCSRVCGDETYILPLPLAEKNITY